MREKNSILNIISNLFVIILQIVLAFVVRFIFVKVLNEQYLGVQGLFTNIISMLSLAELGIGTAISFILYKPVFWSDWWRSRSLSETIHRAGSKRKCTGVCSTSRRCRDCGNDRVRRQLLCREYG